MSRNIVNGFEDIINKYNLTTNGNFHINQRGTFGSLTATKINDFVSDCWKVVALTMDYCEVMNSTDGWLRLQGHGRKDQLISIQNRASNEALGYGQGGIHDPSQGKQPITASLQVNVLSDSVPVQADIVPRYRNGTANDLFSQVPVLTPNGSTAIGRAIRVRETIWNSIDKAANFQLKLMADGEFDIYVYGFNELVGAFRNPPTDVAIPYAEDLQRCERYYQLQEYDADRFPMIQDGSKMYVNARMSSRTKMAASPSVSATLNNIHLYQDAADGSGNTLNDSANWSVSAVNYQVGTIQINLERSSVIASRSIAQIYADVVAEIA